MRNSVRKRRFQKAAEKQKTTHLVEPGVFQSLAKDVAHARQLSHGLVAHGLGHEITVLLRGARHGGSSGRRK